MDGATVEDAETRGRWMVLLLNDYLKVKMTDVDEGMGNCTNKDVIKKLYNKKK